MQNFTKILFLFSISVSSIVAQPVTIKLSEQTICGIDDRLFGHFIEKCSWSGEIGGDLLIDSTTQKPFPIAEKFTKELNVPIMRYPGGTDWDYHNWFELIDNAPGNENPKRTNYYSRDRKTFISNNRLGLNEFLDFTENQKIEPILVINVGDAFFKKISIDSAVNHALALYDYCNLEADKSTFAAIRAKNGREKPFKVSYFEIGNEPWLFSKNMTMDESNLDTLSHYINCVSAIAKALKKRDSNVKIMFDVSFRALDSKINEFKEYADFLVFHTYTPWDINFYSLKDRCIKNSKMKPIDIWKTWVSTPVIDSITGFTSFKNEWILSMIMKSGLPVAVTEWNWNGWHTEKASYDSKIAKGVGAAGYLHAFMRQGDLFKIGCQSMFIGQSWGITTISVNRNKLSEMKILPTGAVTGFYSNHHGSHATQFEVNNLDFYKQPYKANWIKPSPKIAWLDIFTSKSNNKHFVHVISRYFKENTDFKIDINALNGAKAVKVFELLPNKNELFDQNNYEIPVSINNEIKLMIKPQSITVIEIQK
jgi:alpha-N-arabinofuranosidase